MKNILLLTISIIIYIIGKTLTLILLYANPDDSVHSTEASIFFLGSSIFISILYFNLHSQLHLILKVLFILFGIYTIIDSLIFTYVVILVHPLSIMDFKAGTIFILSTSFLCTGLYFLIKNNQKKAINE